MQPENPDPYANQNGVNQNPQAPQQGQSPYPTRPSATMGLPIAQPQKDGPPLKLFVIPLVLVTILFVGTVVWALQLMAQRNDYRDNVSAKVAEAVEVAEQQIREEMEAEFLEREKNPLRQYTGPAQFGAVTVSYPKTWSAYVDESERGSTPLEGRFHPNFVPGERSEVALALTVNVIDETYDSVLEGFQSDAQRGTVRITPYTLPKVPDTLGVRVDGEVEQGFNGSSVLFPLRDKTVQIATLSPQYRADFDNIILPNLEFSP